MRLEPVYLLPPEPDPRIKISRRALVLYGLGAAALGCGGGFGLGRIGTVATPPGRVSADDDNADLEWARSLARGPIEHLAGESGGFLSLFLDYDHDAVLRQGAHRLGWHAVRRPELGMRRAIAQTLLAVHTREGADVLLGDEELVRALQRIVR